MPKKNGFDYDFSGWATKANIKCSDGRTILKDAFKHQDGQIVPLVWMHNYSSPENVLGRALLEHRENGVYAYCSFNGTDIGKQSKELVNHGDITDLSIAANHLKQDPGRNVLHGDIRELSIVLAGANPEARIQDYIAHCDGNDYELCCLNTNSGITIHHSDDDEKKEDGEEENKKKEEDGEENKDSKNDQNSEDSDESEKNQNGENNSEDEDNEMNHSDEGGENNPEGNNKRTVQDVIDGLPKKDQDLIYQMVGAIIQDKQKGDEEMAHNIFENGGASQDEYLTHVEQFEILQSASKSKMTLRDYLEDAIENGELKHSIIDDDGNTIDYGVANMKYLFPEAKNLTKEPDFIKRKTDWVSTVMTKIHHTPFSRVKTTFADITMDDARAKGYIKGKRKKDEVFKVLKRITTPQTIYKKQKLDRDDIVDITDFDVVMWIKREMRMMLDEEIARAILIGDGRTSLDEDHIDPDNVRPIWTDDELFTLRHDVECLESETKEKWADRIIDGAIEALEDYEGSGNPVMFVDKWFFTRSKLIRNAIDDRKYKTKQELCDLIGVNDIIPVAVMKNQTREDSNGKTHKLVGIIVDLSDYNVGADKGGEVNTFDDFDINYNQEIYLIETRISGALIKPKSAVVLEQVFQ